MSRQAAEPGLDRIDPLDHAGEVTPLDDLFDETQLLVGGGGVAIPNCNRRRDEGLSDLIGA